ncbi:MAG TPA: CHAT domain-containing protein [Thermoanaerobaculia bacterium]|nr:CHAT domain-containing protein [Thermoanaerobaculia bacterium]
MLFPLLRFSRLCSPASWTVLACAVWALLAGGCARDEAPAPGEPPKAAAVGAAAPAPTEDPGRIALEKELAAAEQEVERWRKAGDAAKEIEALLTLGWKQDQVLGRDAALATFQTALARSRAAGKGDQEIEALVNVGWALLNKNDPDPEAARKHLEEALRLAEARGDRNQQAHAHHYIGNSHASQGLYAEALASYRRVPELAAAAGEKELAADAWNAMAVIHGYLGHGEEVQRCYERSLALAERPATLTTIGWMHRRRGELEKARDSFEKALLRIRDNEEDQAKVRNHLGGVYLDLGEPERSLEEYRKALEVYLSRHDGEGVAQSLASIGQVHLAQGDARAALARFEEAREPSRAARPRTAAAVLHGIGTARLELGWTEQALEALREALPLRDQGGDRRGKAATLLQLGRAHAAREETDRAASFLRDALGLARQTEASFVQVSALATLARLDRDRGHLKDALQQIEEAISILESIRSDLPGDRFKSSFFASKRSTYELYVDILVRLDQRQPGRGYRERAFQASEMARARSLLDLLAEGRSGVTRGISAELRQQEAEVAVRLAQVQSDLTDELAKDPPQPERVQVLRGRLAVAEDDRQALEERIRKEHPRYAAVRYPSPLNLRRIQNHLDGDTALLEYSLSQEDGSYLFLVTRDHLEVHPLREAHKIPDQVRRVRQGVESPGRRSFAGYTRAALWLYRELVAPVRPELAGKRLLLVVPDGPLHLLAFEALLTGKAEGSAPGTLPYLLRDYAVSYIPSASVLPLLGPEGRPRNQGSRGKRFVAFADPDYGAREVAEGSPPTLLAQAGVHTRSAGMARVRLPRLEGSAREVRQIAELYAPAEVEIYERAQANEGNVKGNPVVERADRLHFGTHGVLNQERPALSGLWLTRSGKDDGLLQVYEIFNLDLRAELVVLSACDTGRGREVRGEGLVGITRAFLYAGAPSVVVSLWRVADQSAPDLMVRFYADLDRAGDKAGALRRAKLEMIAMGGDHARPYYWAPFILVGRPG